MNWTVDQPRCATLALNGEEMGVLSMSSHLWLTVHCALPVAVGVSLFLIGAGWRVLSRLRVPRGDAVNLHRLKTPVRQPRPAKVAQKRYQHVVIRVLVDVSRMPRRVDIGLAAAQVGEMALAQLVEKLAPHAG